MVSTWMGDRLETPCAVGMNFPLHSFLTSLTTGKCSTKLFPLMLRGYKICSPVTNRFED